MRNTKLFKVSAFLSLIFLFAVACGMKPSVHLDIAGGQRQNLTAEEAAELGYEIDPETGELIAIGDEGGTGSSRTSRRTVSGGGSDAVGGGGAVGAAGSLFKAKAGDKTGVSPTTIKIGFHAPLTGAAAVPLADIKFGVNVYHEWLASKGVKIFGRQSVVIFKDDQYNPSHAVEVCRQMVEKDNVFMLIGGAGTDQIIACARYASQKGVPYLSAGVSELVVNKIPEYFAFSMSYPAQTKILAQVVMKYNDPQRGGKVYVNRCDDQVTPTYDNLCQNVEPGEPRVGIVYSDTDGFYDARDAFVRNFKKESGKDVFKTFPITKFEMSDAEATAVGLQLKNSGIDIVFVLTSPTNWLKLLQRAEEQNVAPRWVGVGLTKGVNLVATRATGCAGSRDANFQYSLFLNPWMSVDNATYNKQFVEAWNACTSCPQPASEHDIAFGLFGGSIVQHALLQAAGKDLGRAAFMNVAKSAKNVKAPDAVAGFNIIDIYSELSYSPGDNFGADQAHLLWGDCSTTGRWSDVPGAQFISSF